MDKYVAHVHNGILFSQKKKEQNYAVCRDTEGSRTVIQKEANQKEKNKYRILMHICGI